MKKPMLFLVLSLVLALAIAADAAPTDPNYLQDPNFSQGLAKWKVGGEVQAKAREASLGPKSSISQRYEIPGLRIVYFGAKLQSSLGGVAARVVAKCLGPGGKVVMEQSQDLDPKGAKEGKEVAVYFKTQAFTKEIELTVERTDSAPGTLQVSGLSLNDFDHGKTPESPTCDLDLYMRPIWQGEEVIDETVLMYSQDGKPARGTLLYDPTEIVSVRDSGLGTTYEQGKDFALEGRNLVWLPGSRVPIVKDSDYPKGDYPWLEVMGKHLKVTYRHSGQWEGPTPHYQGDELPVTIGKLESKGKLNVVALGDSITLGLNVSGYLSTPPYMPCWADLFVGRLQKRYPNPKLKLYNVGLGGMTAKWGADNAKAAVAALNPDLVLIAFGMNDFWSVTPKDFRDSIEATIKTVRQTRPTCEFILISTMKFDPAYTSTPEYVGHILDYRQELKGLESKGVALFDMTELSDAIYKVKGAKQLQTDPMHPDDFLARWYAQGLFAMLDHPASGAALKFANRKPGNKNYYLDPNGADDNDGLSKAKPWKTLARASKQSFGPGDQLLLASGATFKGALTLQTKDAEGTKHPVVVKSEGERATILSEGEPGLIAHSGGLFVQNLEIRGAAMAEKKGHDGIQLAATGPGRHEGVRLSNLEISGFGDNGISISAPKNGTNGFQDVQISHVKVHNCFGTGIISADEVADLAKGFAHKNIVVSDCDASNNPSGSGIILSGVEGAVVEYCSAHDNHGAHGGLGMWAWCAKDVVFRYDLVGGTRTGGGDGGGFDLDGGCVNCIVEHCLSYNNDGPGYMHCDYPGAPSTHHNSIQDSISIDDGRKAKGDSVGFGYVTWGSGLDDCLVQRNLAIVRSDFPDKSRRGLFFVSLVKGSEAKGDILHVKGSVFRDNVAEISIPDLAFVLNELVAPTVTDVRFLNNAYNSTGTSNFLEGQEPGKVYDNLKDWRAATGQEKNDGKGVGTQSKSVQGFKSLESLNSLTPRELPNLFRGLKSSRAED